MCVSLFFFKMASRVVTLLCLHSTCTYFMGFNFVFWSRLIRWRKLTLIQTFFYLMVFMSAIRPLQNLNSKIGPKHVKLFSILHICCIYLLSVLPENFSQKKRRHSKITKKRTFGAKKRQKRLFSPKKRRKNENQGPKKTAFVL